MSRAEVFTSGCPNAVEIRLEAVRRPLHRWLGAWARFVVQAVVAWTMDRACWATGHFWWLVDDDDESTWHWACWIIGGPRGRDRRGRLWTWAVFRERPPRYELVAPLVTNGGTLLAAPTQDTDKEDEG